MANAIMEATINIAGDEAKFFQTLTTENLSNRQEAVINKARALSRFEEANLGAREVAAVQNAKAFLEMDLLNVRNEQEAEIINTQERIDVMLSDAAETNVARRFDVEQENDFTKYYDNLNANIEMHRSEQLNAIKRFNAGELNDGAEFEAEMEDSRQRYYSDMQYQIDSDNARWRQSVAETNTELEFEAATEDVRNGLDLSQEAMNQMWDRVDSLLDHTVTMYNNEADRDANILATTITAQSRMSAGGMDPVTEGLFTIAGSILGTEAGAGVVADVLFGSSTAADGGVVGSAISSGTGLVGSVAGAVGSAVSGVSGAISSVGTAAGLTSGAAAVLGPAVLAGAALKAAGVDVDVNPFDEGELEIDLVDTVEDIVNRDWLDWGW
jgi:hypothetical protein